MKHFTFISMLVLLNVSYYAIFPVTFAVQTLKITSVAGPSGALFFLGPFSKNWYIESNHFNTRHEIIASK